MCNPKPEVIAIIPARYKSNRFRGKPLALIAGKPMIQHVVERAEQVSLLSRVVVATDDSRIAECVQAFGGQCVMTAENHVSGSDRLAEAAKLLGISEHDVVVNIQGDQPFFPVEVIEQVVRPLLDDPDLPMSTLIYKIVRPEEVDDPNHVKTVFDRNNFALYFSRSPIPFQRNPEEKNRPTYYKHLGVYAYRKGFLLSYVSQLVFHQEVMGVFHYILVILATACTAGLGIPIILLARSIQRSTEHFSLLQFEDEEDEDGDFDDAEPGELDDGEELNDFLKTLHTTRNIGPFIPSPKSMDDICPCGSGIKYKDCCGKFWA